MQSDQFLTYGLHMPDTTTLVNAAEATRMLGYRHRSSLTRLVQAGHIAPALTADGLTGAQFFERTDVEQLRDKLANSPTDPATTVPQPSSAEASAIRDMRTPDSAVGEEFPHSSPTASGAVS